MADYQEEVYIVERKEISDDEGDDIEFDQMVHEATHGQKDDEFEGLALHDQDDASDDDLNDFNALKTKTEAKAATKKSTVEGAKFGTMAVTQSGLDSSVVNANV